MLILRFYIVFEDATNILAALAALAHLDDQRSASTSQRTDATPLVAGEETAVETTRQERTSDEDIIGTYVEHLREIQVSLPYLSL